MNKDFSTDTALLEGLASGERGAVAEIYRLYRPMLVKWMLTRGGKEEDADDVFQDVLMVLYDKAKSPEFCLTCKLSTYLFAISKRMWYKKLDQASHYSFIDTDEDNEVPGVDLYNFDVEVHLERERHFEKLESALEQLGDPCNKLIKAFYMEDKSMQEIAIDFNYTNSENAKTQKYKCLMRLKKLFFENKIKVNP